MDFVNRYFYADNDYDDDNNSNSIFYFLTCQFNSTDPIMKLTQNIQN